MWHAKCNAAAFNLVLSIWCGPFQSVWFHPNGARDHSGNSLCSYFQEDMKKTTVFLQVNIAFINIVITDLADSVSIRTLYSNLHECFVMLLLFLSLLLVLLWTFSSFFVSLCFSLLKLLKAPWYWCNTLFFFLFTHVMFHPPHHQLYLIKCDCTQPGCSLLQIYCCVTN